MAFVSQVMNKAHARLTTVAEEASLHEVARLLHAGIDIVVVCDDACKIVGIVTKTDLVERLAEAGTLAHTMPVGTVLRREPVTCRPDDDLHSVWSVMLERDLKNLPIVDETDSAVGILNARDALQELLDETENDERLLLDYVMGRGYR